LLSNPKKAHHYAEPRRLTILRANQFKALAVERWKDPEKSRENIFDVQFWAYGKKKPLEGSLLNFACG